MIPIVALFIFFIQVSFFTMEVTEIHSVQYIKSCMSTSSNYSESHVGYIVSRM
jgi:hypothetical protein